MADTLTKLAADFSTTLASKVLAGATTATLSSATDDDGVALPTGTYGFTIDRKNSAKEYIQCTLTGTALTAIRTVTRRTGASTSGFARGHRKGAEVIISDWVAIRRIQDVLETGYAEAQSVTTDYMLATKKYVDDIAYISGSPDADASTKGIVEIATQAEVDSGDDTGSTTAPTVVRPSTVRAKAYHDYAADSVGSDAYAITITPAITAYATGQVFTFKAGTANTGACTLNVSGLGAKTIKKNVSEDLATGDILANQIVKVVYDGTNMQLTSNILNSSSSIADQSQTTQDAVIVFGEADTTAKYNLIAQSFIPSLHSISAVKLYKTANTGTFTGTVKIAIQADTTGSPSGSDLVSLTLTNAQYLALATGEFTAQFATDYVGLTIGSLYWIVLTASTADNANHPNLGTNSAGGYTSGSVKFKNTTDGWSTVATVDLYFKTIQGIQNRVVKTGTDGYVPMTMTQPQRSKTFIYTGTQDISAATNTVTITHGLGYLPSFVRFTGDLNFDNASATKATTTGTAIIASDGTPTYKTIYGVAALSSSLSGTITDGVGLMVAGNASLDDYQKVTISAISEDTIALTFTKTGTPNVGPFYYIVEIFL